MAKRAVRLPAKIIITWSILAKPGCVHEVFLLLLCGKLETQNVPYRQERSKGDGGASSSGSTVGALLSVCYFQFASLWLGFFIAHMWCDIKCWPYLLKQNISLQRESTASRICTAHIFYTKLHPKKGQLF